MQFHPFLSMLCAKMLKGFIDQFWGFLKGKLIFDYLMQFWQLNEKLHLNYANTMSLILFCQLMIVIDAKKLMRMGLKGFLLWTFHCVSSAIWVYDDRLLLSVFFSVRHFLVMQISFFLQKDYFLVDLIGRVYFLGNVT